MSVFQKVYNWIRALSTPKWLQDVLEYVFENVVLPTFKKLAEDGRSHILIPSDGIDLLFG